MKIHEKIHSLIDQKNLKLAQVSRRILENFGPKAIAYRTMRRIHAGETEPTEFSLYQISIGLGITLDELKQGVEQDISPVKIVPKNTPVAQYDHVPIKAIADKLSTSLLKNMDARRLALWPGCKTRIEQDPAPQGEIKYQKLIYVLKGEVTVIVDGKKYLLKKDDTCFFDSNLPHSFENNTSKKVFCLIMQTPPYL